MTLTSKSIRTFIGAKNFDESRRFYQELGFTELSIDDKMSYFQVNEKLGFYLQDYYVKQWVNNSMVFLEVENVEEVEREIRAKGLDEKYQYVRFTEIKQFDWGREFFMHDPSGVLWHFGTFESSRSES